MSSPHRGRRSAKSDERTIVPLFCRENSRKNGRGGGNKSPELCDVIFERSFINSFALFSLLL